MCEATCARQKNDANSSDRAALQSQEHTIICIIVEKQAMISVISTPTHNKYWPTQNDVVTYTDSAAHELKWAIILIENYRLSI